MADNKNADQRVLTAPLALIKAQIGGELRVIGKMRNIRVTETIRRIDVKGIGRFFSDEKAPVDWQGTFTASSYAIDLRNSGLTGSPNRNTNDPQAFANTILLDEKGIDVFIYKKVKKPNGAGVDAKTGIVTEINEEPFAIIRNAFVEREGFDITDGQVSGRDQDFTYLQPVLFSDLK